MASQTSSCPDQCKQDYLISYSLACCRRQFARVKPLKDATIVVGDNLEYCKESFQKLSLTNRIPTKEQFSPLMGVVVYSAVQNNAIHYNAVAWNAVQCNVLRSNRAQ